jgi:hypothetical protein
VQNDDTPRSALRAVVNYAPDDEDSRRRRTLAAVFLLEHRANREAGERQADDTAGHDVEGDQ